jgi:hypothetical protein
LQPLVIVQQGGTGGAFGAQAALYAGHMGVALHPLNLSIGHPNLDGAAYGTHKT